MAATDGVIKVRSVLYHALGHAQVTSRDTNGSFQPLLRCGRLVGPSAPQAGPGRGRPLVGRRTARPTRSDLTSLRPSGGATLLSRRRPNDCHAAADPPGSSDDRARQRVVAATNTESGRTRQPRSARAATGHRVTSTGPPHASARRLPPLVALPVSPRCWRRRRPHRRSASRPPPRPPARLHTRSTDPRLQSRAGATR